MTAKPKQIVLDKNVFQGIGLDSLRSFAKQHLVLASDSLFYECGTATRHNPGHLLGRYEDIIKAGAYYCSMSRTFVEWECRYCKPYSWLLADLTATEQIRRGERRPVDLLHSSTHGEISQPHYKVANAFLNVSDRLKKRIDVEDPRLGKQIRQLSPGRCERFRIWFEFVDSSGLHEIGVDSVPHDWIKDEKQFCVSPEWISWQRIRLTGVVALEYCYLRQSGGAPGEARAEHDYHDMEYVLLLSRADAIITQDKGLIELACAAFPEKDVFSTLEEVPESYRCDWADG